MREDQNIFVTSQDGTPHAGSEVDRRTKSCVHDLEGLAAIIGVLDLLWLVLEAPSSRARIVWYVCAVQSEVKYSIPPKPTRNSHTADGHTRGPVLPNRDTTPVRRRVARARPTKEAEHQHTRQHEN